MTRGQWVASGPFLQPLLWHGLLLFDLKCGNTRHAHFLNTSPFPVRGPSCTCCFLCPGHTSITRESWRRGKDDPGLYSTSRGSLPLNFETLLTCVKELSAPLIDTITSMALHCISYITNRNNLVNIYKELHMTTPHALFKHNVSSLQQLCKHRPWETPS